MLYLDCAPGGSGRLNRGRGPGYQLEQAGGANEDDALSELKAKMGMLEAPKGDNAKQLAAGAAGSAKDDKHADASSSAPSSLGGSLTAEDLKELEDLDLSELDSKEAKKA
jgi:hypothetical protein